MKIVQRLTRVILLITIAATLLGGLGSGLARLGWPMESMSRNWIMVHGPLMISGFLGTLICLERAVALSIRYRWSMAVPLINAAGTVALLLLRDVLLAKLLLALGSLGLVILFVIMLRIHASRDVMIMASGAALWLIGNILWLAGQPIYRLVHLWTAFLVLTIVGERIELSRVRQLNQTGERRLTFAVGIYMLGTIVSIFYLDVGIRLLGVGAVLTAIWLLHYDIARRTIRQDGLPRYIAACLLVGYIWLGFGGGIAIWKGAVYAGPNYAVILHALLLGFVFSMIFGHMPIILPALTGMELHYHLIFYLHLILLHTSLVYRTYGNLTFDMTIRQWGGLLNAISILLFFALTMIMLLRSNVRRRSGL